MTAFLSTELPSGEIGKKIIPLSKNHYIRKGRKYKLNSVRQGWDDTMMPTDNDEIMEFKISNFNALNLTNHYYLQNYC